MGTMISSPLPIVTIKLDSFSIPVASLTIAIPPSWKLLPTIDSIIQPSDFHLYESPRVVDIDRMSVYWLATISHLWVFSVPPLGYYCTPVTVNAATKKYFLIRISICIIKIILLHSISDIRMMCNNILWWCHTQKTVIIDPFSTFYWCDGTTIKTSI